MQRMTVNLMPLLELVRAERTLLTARMQRLRLLVDARINRAELLYLAGDST